MDQPVQSLPMHVIGVREVSCTSYIILMRMMTPEQLRAVNGGCTRLLHVK